MTLVDRSTPEIVKLIISQVSSKQVPGVQWEYDFDPVESGMRVAASIDIEKKRIKLSVPHIEYVWACSQLFYVWYVASLEAHKHVDSPQHSDLVRIRPELDDALILFEQKRCRVFTCEDTTFDVESSLRCSDTDYDSVNSLCSGTFLVYVLHEMGHGELDHSNIMVPATSMKEEREADDFAAEKLFEMSPPRFRTQFGFCLCTAMLSLFPPVPRSSGAWYPELHERLTTMIFAGQYHDNDHVYWFLLRPLSMFMHHWEIDFENEEVGESLADKVIEYNRMLSRHMSRIG